MTAPAAARLVRIQWNGPGIIPRPPRLGHRRQGHRTCCPGDGTPHRSVLGRFLRRDELEVESKTGRRPVEVIHRSLVIHTNAPSPRLCRLDETDTPLGGGFRPQPGEPLNTHQVVRLGTECPAAAKKTAARIGKQPSGSTDRPAALRITRPVHHQPAAEGDAGNGVKDGVKTGTRVRWRCHCMPGTGVGCRCVCEMRPVVPSGRGCIRRGRFPRIGSEGQRFSGISRSPGKLSTNSAMPG